MKLIFIQTSTDHLFEETIELDSRIPVPRTGELVLLTQGNGYFQFRVMKIVHAYVTGAIFIHVEREQE